MALGEARGCQGSSPFSTRTSGGDIPDSDCAVVSTRDQRPSIGAEDEVVDRSEGAGGLVNLIASHSIPNLDRSCSAGRTHCRTLADGVVLSPPMVADIIVYRLANLSYAILKGPGG